MPMATPSKRRARATSPEVIIPSRKRRPEALTTREQEILELIWSGFKNKEIALLLATDLVARGIDIDNLECVLNFDLPRNQEAYTHRAGRTGRMGKEGLVITLISNPNDLKVLKKYAPVSELVLKNQQLYKV